MKFAQAVEEVIKASKAGLPVLLMGSPGIGKTAIPTAVGKVLELGLSEVRPAEFEPVDFRGIPSVENKRTTWNVPDFWPSEPCVLNFDEITQAPMELTSSLLKMFLGGGIGDYRLPEGTVLVATGNYVSDRAGCSRLSAALRERCVVINLEADYGEWRVWYAAQDHADERILEFLDSAPGLFCDWDPKKDHNQPTPRNWARVSKILPFNPAEETLAGIIGPDVAAMFTRFCRANVKLPTVAEVLREGRPLPKSPSQMAKFVEKLAAFAVENVEDEKWRNDAIALAESFDAEAYQVQFCKLVAKLSETAIKRPEFKKLVAKHRVAIVAGRRAN